MRIAPDGRTKSPVASHQGHYCGIKTNSFFAYSSSSGFAADPEIKLRSANGALIRLACFMFFGHLFHLLYII
jgi:hypothetical protein